MLLQEKNERKNMKEDPSCHSKDKWINTMEEEMEYMRISQVWKLVGLPKGRKAIGTKWVFKIKHKIVGTVERYKAQLVTKRYTQQEGIDYDETFSPIVWFTSTRLILLIVASLDLELHQMDVKITLLNGALSEEIYMEQLDDFI